MTHPVDQAILEGRVPPAKRAAYVRLYDSDPAGTRALLASLPPAVPLAPLGGSTPEGSETWRAPDAYPTEWLDVHDPPDTQPGSITMVSD